MTMVTSTTVPDRGCIAIHKAHAYTYLELVADSRLLASRRDTCARAGRIGLKHIEDEVVAAVG
jgi:hypothetical protein